MASYTGILRDGICELSQLGSLQSLLPCVSSPSHFHLVKQLMYHLFIAGFGRAVAGYDPDSADIRIYQITYFVSWPLAFIAFMAINHFWPPEGLGIAEGLDEQGTDGTVTPSSNPEDCGLEKTAVVSEKTASV
jgi:hypothetical protein